MAPGITEINHPMKDFFHTGSQFGDQQHSRSPFDHQKPNNKPSLTSAYLDSAGCRFCAAFANSPQ
jgi:hypothetical protein